MAPQNILALTLLLAIVATFVWRIRSTPTVQPKPERVPFQKCDNTGCPYHGWIPVTRRATKESAKVCTGCFNDGHVRGSWIA